MGERKLVERNERYKEVKTQLQILGLPKEVLLIHLIAALVTFLTLVLWMWSGVRAITNLVAFVYPAWQSLKALESDDKGDDTFWLAYWVIYGAISTMESITDVFFFWIPMYELFIKPQMARMAEAEKITASMYEDVKRDMR